MSKISKDCEYYVRCSECFMPLDDCICTERIDKHDEFMRAKAVELALQWVSTISLETKTKEIYNYIKTGFWNIET